MVVYNIITSQGQKLQLDLNMNSRIEVICEYLFSLVENMEYITTFDLSLRYENIVLINDKLLIEYNYPSNTKLSFIIKKKGIDIPSPSIYDSPLSLNNSLSNSNENVNLLKNHSTDDDGSAFGLDTSVGFNSDSQESAGHVGIDSITLRDDETTNR